MPKRNRTREQRGLGIQAPVEPVISEQERAAKLFVDSVKSHDAADRAERQRQRDEAARAARHAELQATRQAAADHIKRLRASHGKGQQLIDAEAAYRAALAELQEFETGERPHWAPVPPAAEVDGEAGRPDESDGG